MKTIVMRENDIFKASQVPENIKLRLLAYLMLIIHVLANDEMTNKSLISALS